MPEIRHATALVPAFQQPVSDGDQTASLAAQRDLMRLLTALPVADSIGVACSYLLYAALNHPDVLRRVLNDPVVREGFRGESLLNVIKRACR
jgi:hypothetical protein